MGPAAGRATADISVVVPTVGRAELLARCLASIARCDPQPAEVLVVDQSGAPDVEAVVTSDGDDHDDGVVRLVRCHDRGIAAGTNLGLREAASSHVAVTHDDCTVDLGWVGAAARHAASTPDAIVTGRVLPVGAAEGVPSTKTSEVPFDFTGLPFYGVLYPANMVVPRDEVLAIGGFDERPSLRLAAEDNDLCYRWLTSGRSLRYEPELVVWHHDWRPPEELVRLYVRYARGQGAFYAKHLVRGDRRMPRLLLADLGRGARSVVGGLRHRRPRWQDERRGLLSGLPPGLWLGLVDEARLRWSRRRAPGG